VNGPIDLTDEMGATVVSIEVLRRNRHRRHAEGACKHKRTEVDEDLAELLCKDCGLRLNPIAWVASLAEDWSEVDRLWKGYRAERERLEERRRVKCHGCGTMLTLCSTREDEKRRKESRLGRYEDALQRIALLVPEAAGKYAAKVAREALAAQPASEAVPPRARLAPAPVRDPTEGTP
jgi:hypothetical protein